MENNDLNFDSRVPLEELRDTVDQIKKELATIIVGQKDFIELLIVSVLSDGHALIEGAERSFGNFGVQLQDHRI